MQITLNIPDDLPFTIIQQYIKTVENQILLMSQLKSKDNSQLPSLKRGSAKKMITFISDDFCEPLDEFQDYM